LWLIVPLLVIFRAEVLEILQLTNLDAIFRLGSAAFLIATAALLLSKTAQLRLRALPLGIPLTAMVLLALNPSTKSRRLNHQPVIALAEWVRRNTWGSSMFLFPDGGRSSDPGLFRGRSERALWVDWNSGTLVPCFQSFAAIWWDRWHTTMQPSYSPQRLQTDLSLPIDYYVLTRANRLSNVKPVFANEEFLLYDANDLRSAPGPLRSAAP
jgi:hypothetical protein